MGLPNATRASGKGVRFIFETGHVHLPQRDLLEFRERKQHVASSTNTRRPLRLWQMARLVIVPAEDRAMRSKWPFG